VLRQVVYACGAHGVVGCANSELQLLRTSSSCMYILSPTNPTNLQSNLQPCMCRKLLACTFHHVDISALGERSTAQAKSACMGGCKPCMNVHIRVATQAGSRRRITLDQRCGAANNCRTRGHKRTAQQSCIRLQQGLKGRSFAATASRRWPKAFPKQCWTPAPDRRCHVSDLPRCKLHQHFLPASSATCAALCDTQQGATLIAPSRQ